MSLDYLVGRSEVKNELESQEQITKFLERYDHITLAEVIRLLECQRGWMQEPLQQSPETYTGRK